MKRNLQIPIKSMKNSLYTVDDKTLIKAYFESMKLDETNKDFVKVLFDEIDRRKLFQVKKFSNC